VDLRWQMQWRGAAIQNIFILVCDRCLDIPQQQLRQITFPADPEPIMNARVQDFVAASTDYRSLSEVTIDPVTGIPKPSQVLRITDDCLNRTVEPYGAPIGLDQPAVMPYNGAVQKAFGAPVSLLSVTSNGTNIITATCFKPHGLKTDDQISAAGLNAANGFFSVVVVNPMVFTWAVVPNIQAAALLTGTSRVVPTLVGLPRSSATIPQVTSHSRVGGTQTVPGEIITGSGSPIITGSGSPIVVGP